MATNKPVKAGHLLSSLYYCVRNAKGLDNIPGLLRQILKDDLWKEVYIEEFEKTVTYEHFEDFITFAPPEGLGSSIDTIQKLCHDHKDILNLITNEVNRGQGNPSGNNQYTLELDNTKVGNIDNVNITRSSVTQKETGNSKDQGLRRLTSEIDKAKSPERREKVKALQQQVFNNEISVNKAMIIIGARRQTFTIPVEPESAAKSILKRFTPEQITELVRLLSEK